MTHSATTHKDTAGQAGRALPHFQADKQGLARQMEGRDKSFVVFELVQNALDQDVREVLITMEPVAGKPWVRLIVEDDDPNGFADLSHAWTLYAESAKKTDPTKRGRFNLGEKLVVALAQETTIETTTGTVVFNADGRRHYPRRKRTCGSRFACVLRATRAEYEEMRRGVERLIVPPGVRTVYNGEQLEPREPLAEFEATLPTIIAGADGVLRRTRRKTAVRVFEPLAGEPATLYELGIPVVETSDRYDVDVSQKVPLGSDRDNVPPGYLRELRARVLDATHEHLDEHTASESWVAQSLEDPHVSDAAVNAVLAHRYGDKRVVRDPSDPEAVKLAVSRGFAVIEPGSFSRKQWHAIRRSGAALPAGQVTPSPKPYSDDPNAPVRKELPRNDWTSGMERIVAFSQRVSERLTGERPRVLLVNDRRVSALATYGRGSRGATLEFNVARLGRRWFDQEPASEQVMDLLLHELGHHYSGDHLSSGYHDALTSLGARLARLALQEPDLFADA